MIRLLFTALLCALASSQATAQNWLSQALLGVAGRHDQGCTLPSFGQTAPKM
jgi:hypothetical protein